MVGVEKRGRDYSFSMLSSHFILTTQSGQVSVRRVVFCLFIVLILVLEANQSGAAYPQDNLDEMTTGASNVIFLIMWPVFSLMLVSTPIFLPLLGLIFFCDIGCSIIIICT